MTQAATLSPFVFWGQTSDSITLRIDLKNVKSPLITLKEEMLNFFAIGIGAKGLNEYAFMIEFYSEVIPEKSFYKINDRSVEFVLKKKTLILWPRLLNSSLKPQWIKVDFDKIKQKDCETTSEESEVEQLTKRNMPPRNVKDKNFGRGRKINKEDDFKKSYLFLYNLVQFVGFIYIFVVFIIHYFKGGPDTISTIYPSLRKPIKFLNCFQIIEIIHPLIGYTSGIALTPFIQWSGRTFNIMLLIDQQVELQSHYTTFYLLLVYTLAELVRYPYYMLHVYKVNIRFVTWIRYSAWMVLYPLGFTFEALLAYNSIPHLEKSGKFSLLLPNAWNFGFYMPAFIRLYLTIIMIPLSCFLYSHMLRQRNNILNVLKKKIN